jgi:hypothetical protein
MRRLAVIAITVVVALLADILYGASATFALGAGGLFLAVTAVILWRTEEPRYVTAGFALAALCSFGMCGLCLYDDRSWVGVVLAVVMLTGLFGSLGIEKRLHREAMKKTADRSFNNGIPGARTDIDKTGN